MSIIKMALNLTNVGRRMPQGMYRRPSSGKEIKEYIIESRTEPERNPNYQPNVNRGNQLVTNKNLSNFIPNNGNVLKKIDKQGSIDNLINRQIGIMKEEQDILDGYRQDKSYTNARHAQFLRDTEDEYNTNKETLKALGVSPDQVRGEYYKLYPTPEMLGAQALARDINNWMYENIPQGGITTQNGGASQNQNILQNGNVLQKGGFVVPNNNNIRNQEAKRLITNELKRMNAAGELTKDISRTKKLIDLYKKLK